MKKWLIFGIEERGISDIIVIAESFDEALKAAREIDSNYIGGCMIRKYYIDRTHPAMNERKEIK